MGGVDEGALQKSDDKPVLVCRASCVDTVEDRNGTDTQIAVG